MQLLNSIFEFAILVYLQLFVYVKFNMLTKAMTHYRLHVSHSDPSRSFLLRLVLTIAAILVIYIMAQVNAVSVQLRRSLPLVDKLT